MLDGRQGGRTMELDYSAAGIDVRDDLRETHEFLLNHLSRPGSWWSGAQRIGIASEARNATSCRLCDERKNALSPEHVQGKHDSITDLTDNVVEVIHRIRTDPARVSRDWFEQRLADGLSKEQYVEVVGVVTLGTGIEMFCRSLGIPAFPLPAPQTGEPTGYRPANASAGEAWVPMIAADDATGPEADLYGDVPDPPNIMRALSLVPDEARALQHSSDAHYVPVASIADPSVRRDLDRMQMELIASRSEPASAVSAAGTNAGSS